MAVAEDAQRMIVDSNGVEVDFSSLAVTGTVTATDATWSTKLVEDEAANDSDKTLTVSTDEEWQILWANVEFAATADVGDRQLVMVVTDASDDVLFLVPAKLVQAESLTYEYMFSPGVADMDTAYQYGTPYNVTVPLPAPCVLSEGYKIRFYDINAIAATADDMTIHMQVAYRSV